MDRNTALRVFFELHSNLPREGPGDDASTAQAFSLLPSLPEQPRILDIGCGPGMQTLQLARLTSGPIIAVDNHAPYLDQLRRSLASENLGDRVEVLKADMQNLPFDAESFDLLWAEGSAYIMEFGNALRSWRSLLRAGGYVAVSEISWIRPEPPEAIEKFWQQEYPTMQTVEANLDVVKSLGYLPIAHFLLPESAWWAFYYTPLEQRIAELQPKYADNSDALEVLESHQREIDLYRRYSDYYGYVFYIAQIDEPNFGPTYFA